MICTASAQESVPRWMAGKGRGWVTAEYGMLPASTGERKQRDATRGRQDGRTVEIQRLIGRSLRGVIDFEALGERTIYLDCDVLQADGGTRCASITGAYVALALACARLQAEGQLERSPLTGSVAAVSCGMVDGAALLDLDYSEDSTAEVDANVVMTGEGGLVEVQATAERTPLSRAHLDELLALAGAGHRAAASRAGAGDRQAVGLKLLLATHNEHKRREFARLLGSAATEVEAAAGGRELPPEDGETFAENALGKARAAARATGKVSIADDSGIEAAALGGAPGVRSARYAGEHATDEENLAKLLREAPAGSALEYVCAIAYVDPGRASSACSRAAAGTPGGGAPRRAGGFGYDPAFLPDDGPPATELTGERRPDDGRAVRRAEGRDQPSRPRGAGAARAGSASEVDRRRDRDREAEAGIAVVAGEQQQQRGEQRDEHRHDPGDAVDGHRALWHSVADAPVRVRC